MVNSRPASPIPSHVDKLASNHPEATSTGSAPTSESLARRASVPSHGLARSSSLGPQPQRVQGGPSRRQRSIHINIKPDPTPPASSFGVNLAGWLPGSSSNETASPLAGPYAGHSSPIAMNVSSSSAMDANRRSHSRTHPSGSSHAYSEADAHTAALANLRQQKGDRRQSTASNKWSTRWAGLVRTASHRIERDGLRKAIWGRQLGGVSSSINVTGGPGMLNEVWDRIRRIPEILWVESEDPVASSSLWQQAGQAEEGDMSSDDTENLLEEEHDSHTSPRKRLESAQAKRPRRRPSAFVHLNRSLDRWRRFMGVSRPAFFLLLCMLVLGAWETFRSKDSTARSLYKDPALFKVYANDPFRTLRDAGISIPASSQVLGDARKASQACLLPVPAGKARTTAIVLSWKRLDNLIVILAHLCSHAGSIFDSTIIWNNNPDIRLTAEMLSQAKCPKGHLRIYNSPGNQLFFARFLACSLADTPNCYFQDDDWLVPSLPAVHAHFMRNPAGPAVVATGDEFPIKEGWEWCFSNSEYSLNTCFAWLGTGAFVSQAKVLQTLEAISVVDSQPISGRSALDPLLSDEVSMFDNYFTTLQNEPPFVITSRMLPLPQPVAFTAGGEGDRRNEMYIQNGIDRLASHLGFHQNPLLKKPLIHSRRVQTTEYQQTIDPQTLQPASKHTYRHHTRSAAHQNDFLFMTSVANLPPPDSVTYEPHAQLNISRWEQSLTSLWTEGKSWAERWPYYAAVDGDERSAWRSPDVVRKGDYIGLDMLQQLDADLRRDITIHILLEHAEEIAQHIVFETSSDGFTWSPIAKQPKLSCRLTGHLSSRPKPPFPSTFLNTEAARKAIEGPSVRANSSWILSKRRLRACEVTVSTSTGAARRKGWRFIRLTSSRDLHMGWGIYELWIS